MHEHIYYVQTWPEWVDISLLLEFVLHSPLVNYVVNNLNFLSMKEQFMLHKKAWVDGCFMIVTTCYPLQITLNWRLLLPFPNIRMNLHTRKAKYFIFNLKCPCVKQIRLVAIEYLTMPILNKDCSHCSLQSLEIP